MFPAQYRKFVPSLMILAWMLAFVLAVRRLDILWLVLGGVSFLLMLGVTRVEDTPSLKWELISFLMIPLFLGMTGISKNIEFLFLGVDIALVIIVPTIGFMIMFNMHHHTLLHANLPFAIFFVGIFTLASGALIGIGEYMSDKHLGTRLLESNTDLMVDLMAMAAGGLIVGYLLRNYLRTSHSESIQSLTMPMEVDSEGTPRAVGNILYSGFGDRGHRWAPPLSRFMQMLIFIFAIYAIYEGNVRWFFSSVLAFGVTMTPNVLTRNMKIVVPPLLNLWICAALFLHAVGGVLGLYSDVWWWDHLTHFISSGLVSILGFTVLLTIARLSRTLYIPPLLLPVFILLFILATGVIWEIFEFFCDSLLGTNMQYSLTDTVYDMIFNTVGALFASVIGYRYFLSEYRKIGH